MILLDTHALIWLTNDSAQLGKKSADIARAAWDQERLAVSAISFWELAMIRAKNQVELIADPVEMRKILLNTGLIEIPVDGEIAMLSVRLNLPHKDPADRLIAATAIVKGAMLLTADAKLLKWKHALKRHDAAR
ncbi:MAG: type II toxin-antitoxin system VapC family toxin [Rhodocyclaceae bacterium]|nr:type II toxin-antitoxin system VapC family toxin [Rhodocyclaceae bacterium]